MRYSPGASVSTLNGVVPLARPLIVTAAPGGRDSTASVPVDADADAVAGRPNVAGPPSLARGRASFGEISPERPAAAEADVPGRGGAGFEDSAVRRTSSERDGLALVNTTRWSSAM